MAGVFSERGRRLPPPRLSLQGDPARREGREKFIDNQIDANIGEVCSRPARCTRGAVDRFGIPSKERVGDWGGPPTVWSLLWVAERVPQGRTESGGIVLAANAGPRVPSGGVTLKRRCTYRPSVIYLIVNKLLSLAPSLSLSLSPGHREMGTQRRSLARIRAPLTRIRAQSIFRARIRAPLARIRAQRRYFARRMQTDRQRLSPV